MTAREVEVELLMRCASAALGATASAQAQREANIFRLAAMVLRPRMPEESAWMWAPSNAYFSHHPGTCLQASDVVRNGWISSMPRFRDMLSRELKPR